MRKTALLVITAIVLFSCSREKKAAPGAAKRSRTVSKTESSFGPAAVEVGSAMPRYTAQTIDGKKFDVAAERGKVVLLNVWATWCGPCRFEIPALDKLHAKYQAKGFEVVGVSIDEGEPAPVKQFVSEHEMHYPIVLDPDGKLANLFQTTVIPTSVLIDRKGKVVWKKYGVIEENEAQLLSAIKKSL
jgi:cytochrome c biogenesis protein CcmG, thiol:disulfide interchange protein DsbE